MTNIVGAAFLGVTVGCARCHDHKFDPFRQSDYYRMQALLRADPAERHRAGEPRRSRSLEGQGRARRSRRCDGCKCRCASAPGRREGQAREADRRAGRQDAGAAAVHLQRQRRSEEADADPYPVPRRLSEPRAKVGVRPLGILLPDGAPEAAARHARSRALKLANGSPIRRIR